MQRILLLDDCADEAVAVFDRYQGMKAECASTLSKEELIRIIPLYDAVIVRSPTKLTADVIARGEKLRFIGRAGVGVDNIDLDEATRRGIIVINSPSGNTITTAEHTIALLLSLARRVPQAHASIRKGEWDRKRFRGVELYGKTLGIIGLGKVGREVAKRLLCFSMRVMAADPFVPRDEAAKLGVELVDMPVLLKESHFITIHVPLADSTRSLISSKEIGMMRDGVYIVNCARGGIVDEKALEEALESGKVAGVACDVYCSEPPGRISLMDHENSVFTPHIGAATREAQVRVAVDVAEAVAEALAGGPIRNAVNEPGR